LREAFERLEKEIFGVVLLDLGLPDSQGFDTFYQVYDKASGVPIIVLTGLDDEELGLQAGQNTEIGNAIKFRVEEPLKPVSPEKLRERLSKHLTNP